VHSHFGLKLRLILAGIEADVGAVFAPARDMKQLDEAREMRPLAPCCQHRRPAGVVILVANIAASVARVECVDTGAEMNAAERARQRHICRAEAVVDPSRASLAEAHLSAALESLRPELSARSEVGDKPDMIE